MSDEKRNRESSERKDEQKERARKRYRDQKKRDIHIEREIDKEIVKARNEKTGKYLISAPFHVLLLVF